MSGHGAPQLVAGDASELEVVVVASCWHDELMSALISGAERGLAEWGVVDARLVRVPGSFELPVVAAAAARAGADAVVALGVVIRGDTPHFDYVCAAVSTGLMQVSVSTGVPMGFGVLTCDTVAQAWARSGLPGAEEDKGAEAAVAAVRAALAVRQVCASGAGADPVTSRRARSPHGVAGAE
jgi:6,7-dimethyl-8-ribityllumazine synthase